MKRFVLFSLVLLLLPLFGCRTESPHSATGFACDTVVTVTAYAPQETVDAALSICTDYEKVLSKTVGGSDVWRMNHANGEPVTVDPETAAILSLAVEIGALSDGAFDVTVAPASALWDFTSEEPVLPDPDALRAACERIDYRNIVIEGNTVTLRNGAEIDLGGIAKGYIADRVAEYLRSQGVTSACINMGGNVVTIGTKPNGDPWTIGVRDPNGAPDESEEVLSVADGAVVTSGTYERGFTVDGVRYHHILDPETGMPVRSGLASVTIVGTRSDLCDALSTACFVLGEYASKPILDRFGVSAIFLYDDGSRSAYPES